MEEFKVPTLPPPVATTKTEKISTEPPKEEQKDLSEKEQQQQQQLLTECPYKVPSWSAKPSDQDTIYKFEVLKSGQIIEVVDDLQKKPVWKFGRLPENDIVMAHPTISRFHAVLQYRPTSTDDQPTEGWYIYDLESTHGTFLNKQRIPPRVYMRVRVGHMLRLGASTRSYILQGPSEDEEPESELSVTELREKRLNAEEMKRQAKMDAEERLRNEGIDWGMGEDADEETDLTHNPYACTNNEELFLDDPKKTLRGYFEREDIPLEYKCDEMSAGCFVCRVELPIYDSNGRPIVAEVVHKGRKKECVVQCALEACRILDRHGVLRQANQEPLRRKAKAKDSDSDDDEFWDRTGDVAKRKQRKANSNASVTLTYDDLIRQELELNEQLQRLEADIAEYQLKEKKEKERLQAQDGADLDSFMQQLNEDASKLDKTEIKKLRLEQQRLKAEIAKHQRLIKIAKPFDISLAIEKDNAKNEQINVPKKQLPLIGKRNQFSKFKIAKLPTTIVKSTTSYASDEEEMDDDNDKPAGEEISNQTAQKLSIEVQTPEDLHEAKNEASNTECATIKGPAALPNDVDIEDLSNTHKNETNEAEDGIMKVSTSTEELKLKPNDYDAAQETKKRHRQRPRHRNKRNEVDIDELDEHEIDEKYAKWIPPPDQTGDGFTSLNEKYGY